MKISLNLLLALLNTSLYLLILPEVTSLPPVEQAFSTIFGTDINKLTMYLINTALFICIPMLAMTSILSMLKPQLFSINKCIIRSYSLVFYILITTYMLRLFKSLFIFYTKLAISDSYYVLIRISKYYNHFVSYLLPYDLICSFLMHTGVFIGIFAAAEMYITFISNTSTITVKSFLLKNRLVLSISVLFVLFYMILICFIEHCIAIYKISLGTIISMNFTRFYESFLINALCLYLYVVVATTELLE